MNSTTDRVTDLTIRMRKAFALVCPAAHAKNLADRGMIPAAVAAEIDWKERIGEIVLDSQLDAAGLTIDDVKDAIEFFTATTATVSREPAIKSLGYVSFVEAQSGFLVLAPGYRRGPAA